MEFKELAKNRYSSRDLSGGKPEKEKLDNIIETAIIAPTAVNKQPFKIFVMESERAKEVIHEVTKFTFGAETFLVVAADPDQGWVRKYDGKKFADVDASIVATHIMLEIEDQGLNTTWVGHFNAPLLKENFPEMKDYELIAIFPIGYKGPEGEASERHEQRKTREELVEVL